MIHRWQIHPTLPSSLSIAGLLKTAIGRQGRIIRISGRGRRRTRSAGALTVTGGGRRSVLLLLLLVTGGSTSSTILSLASVGSGLIVGHLEQTLIFTLFGKLNSTTL
uniref:Transmembrane protein n=1 Tax=Arabidopsis thaliana TaxID=3702 RepID=Q6DYB6_ARATH|nr:hypothetical protein At3G60230 [Arabidopsis thaliana]AAT67588.1 hypothetical protein At3G60230 [Arabidopsis thaliana]